MARCPDCNKFVSFDSDSDPEVNIDISSDGEVTGDVQIANNCAECGTEMTTASLDVSVSADEIKMENGKTLAAWIAELTDAGRDALQLEVEEDGTERTERFEGKGRGQTHFYGAKVDFKVKATIPTATDENPNAPDIECEFTGEWADDIQSSAMDEQF